MIYLERDEIIAELNRMGINDTHERTVCLKEYIEYFHFHNVWLDRLEKVRKITKRLLSKLTNFNF